MAEIVGEEESSSLSPEIQNQKVEELATKKGWSPLDKWSGAPEDWVPAKEFVGREKLYDRIHDLKKELQKQSVKFQENMEVVQGHFAKVREQEYNRALKELKQQKVLAISEKDIDAVEQIDVKISEVEKEQRQVKVETQTRTQSKEPSPQFIEWRKANAWFDSNQEMQQDAISIGVGYAAAHQGISEDDVYKYVTGRIRKMYPEEFDKRGNKQVMEDTKVESSTTGKGSFSEKQSGKGKLSVNDLNDQQRGIMKTIIKSGALKKVAAANKRTEQEEYLVQLEQNL